MILGRVTNDNGQMKVLGVKNIALYLNPDTMTYATDVASGLFIGGESAESFVVGGAT
jgi:hypothetical protein